MFQASFVVKEVGGKLTCLHVSTDAQAAEKAYEVARLEAGNEVVAFFQTPTPRLTAYPASEAAAAKAAAREREENEARTIEANRQKIENDVKDAEAKLKAAKAVAAQLPKPAPAK